MPGADESITGATKAMRAHEAEIDDALTGSGRPTAPQEAMDGSPAVVTRSLRQLGVTGKFKGLPGYWQDDRNY